MKLNLINLLSKVLGGLRWCLLGVSGFSPPSLWDVTSLDPSHGLYGLQELGGKRFQLVLGFSLETEIPHQSSFKSS